MSRYFVFEVAAAHALAVSFYAHIAACKHILLPPLHRVVLPVSLDCTVVSASRLPINLVHHRPDGRESGGCPLNQHPHVRLFPNTWYSGSRKQGFFGCGCCTYCCSVCVRVCVSACLSAFVSCGVLVCVSVCVCLCVCVCVLCIFFNVACGVITSSLASLPVSRSLFYLYLSVLCLCLCLFCLLVSLSLCLSVNVSLAFSCLPLSPVPAVVEAWSSRIVEGHSGDSRAQVSGAQNEGNRGGEGGGAGAARPNVVIVVLESTTGTLVTPSNHAGVSPWASELAKR